MTTPATQTSPVPDCTAALLAWEDAYHQRDADGAFLRTLEALMGHVRDLLVAAPTGGGPLTFAAIDRMPQPAQDFYSELTDASESLAELIADHSRFRTAYRHAALVLIGDALGALRDDRLKALIAECECWECEEQLGERTTSDEEGTGA
uniref:hypothetical protein n=1 Tax=Streptomyces chartreusis TaxID=1969 RepID=UPI003F498F45